LKISSFNWIVKPITRLAGSLSFANRTLAFAFINVLVLSLVTFQLSSQLNKTVDSYRAELKGISFFSPLMDVFLTLQRYQIYSMTGSKDTPEYINKIADYEKYISDHFKTLQILSSESKSLTSQLDELVEDWERLKSGEREFEHHKSLTLRLYEFSSFVSDYYGMHKKVDDNYYQFSQVVMKDISLMQERLFQLNLHLLQVNQGITGLNKTQLDDDIYHVEQSLAFLNRYIERNDVDNYAPISTLRDKVKAQFLFMKRLVETKEFTMGSLKPEQKSFFDIKDVHQNYYELVSWLIAENKNIKQQKLAELENEIYAILIFVGIAIFLALYFSLGVYLVGNHFRKTVYETTKALVEGDFTHRIDLKYNNEIKKMSNSFNAVADKLTQLINDEKKSRKRVQSIIDSSLDAIIRVDKDSNTLSWNKQAEDILGWKSEEILGKNLNEIITPERYKKDPRTEMDNYLKYGDHDFINKMVETKVIHKDGREITVEMSITASEIDGEYDFSVFIRDITERKYFEKKQKLLNHVFSDTHQGVLITDKDTNILDVNPAFSKITGYSREEVLGKKPSILNSGKQEREFYEGMWAEINRKGYWQGEIWNRKKTGELYAELLTVSAIKNKYDFTTNYVGLFSDITDSKHQEKELKMMAYYDVLTRLPNRILFADRFTQAIAHAKRNETMLAVCFLDLDDFKPVNDNFGHNVGDQILIEIANRITGNIREEDTVSRLGGDEFVILLGEVTHQYQCEQLLDRLVRELSKSYVIADREIQLTISIGVSLYPDHNPEGERAVLLRQADMAMYQAKKEKGSTFVWYIPEYEKLSYTSSIELSSH